jgi:predicted LPLAT superfamily acyltransferase
MENRVAVRDSKKLPRNPGPEWGFAFMMWADQWWPRWIFQAGLMIGSWVGLTFMPEERKHSRDYLRLMFRREPRLIEVWMHFYAFSESLMQKLRAARGRGLHCELVGSGEAFEQLARSDRPALFGTFHFGSSDLLGYLLSDFGRRVSIVRLRVGNSDDTHLLGKRFSEHVAFLWVNDPQSMLFELKDALNAGVSLAMKCDRVDYSARPEPFQFLGAKRLFPFTIYHLAVIFDRPVVFCHAVPTKDPARIEVHSSSVFLPSAELTRAQNLERAREHYQEVLAQWEELVRAYPLQWFNFLPMNPEAPSA